MPRSATTTIDYDRAGSGEPVVLVHGIGHRREAWGQVPALLLAAGYEVITVDLPGFGRSPMPRRPDKASVKSTVTQLERFFDEIGLDRPHVIGNSLGGLMVLLLASNRTVRSATALSPAGFVPLRHLPWVTFALMLLKISSLLPRRIVRFASDRVWMRRISLRSLCVHPEKVPPEVAYGDALNLRSSPGFWPHMLRGPWLRYVDGVDSDERPRVPTTVAWGDTDRLLLPSQARIARDRMPRAEHVTLAHCGHCPQVDDPDLVVRVAEETFLRGQVERQAA